jgi:hypothetical protein
MDFRIGYRRPLRTVWLLRKKRQRIGYCIAAAVAAAAAVTATAWQSAPAPAVNAAAAKPVFKFAAADVTPAASASRRVYPYSIVPGGVANREDLQRQVSTDQVVARHYASFDIGKAHAVTVAKPRAVHVSYRKGDKVYWTAGTVMLAAGETVLSDGASEIRGRCGNRISDRAMLPVAMNEPTEQELDAAVTVAMDPDDAGGLQNASFSLDDALPAGSATSFQRFAGLAQSDTPPASPYTRATMPAMPAFSNGVTEGSGMQGTRFLTVSSGPTDAVAPATEGAATVTPDSTTATPAAVVDPATPVSSSASAPAQPATGVAATTPATPATPATTGNASTPATAADTATGTPAAAAPVASTPAAPAVPAKTPLPQGDIPEPATLWLSGVAFAGMLLARRRKGRTPAA